MTFAIPRILLLATALTTSSVSVLAQSNTNGPVLSVPIRCDIGKDCFIQHYIDMDPTQEASDYSCGSLTYENHRGTDIRVKTVAAMNKGVAVIAAADGKVRNLRDGIEDQYFSDYSNKKRKEIFNIGLGNVVVVGHRNKWDTFYAHLKKGSLTVKKGQMVKKGDLLGYIGMSGLTDFPHLHFELRHKNKRIDPFSGLTVGSTCGKVDHNFWSREAKKMLSYSATGFLASGLSETRPSSRKDLESGRKAQAELNATAPTLFFWSYYYGSRAGDIVTTKIVDPTGKVIANNTAKPKQKNQITNYVFAGKKKPVSGWKPGLYRGEITILRDDALLKDSAIISVK